MEALYDEQGETAEKLLRKAIELSPDKPDLQNNLATALLIQNKTEEADKRQTCTQWWRGTCGISR